jgi:hypothetical protein
MSTALMKIEEVRDDVGVVPAFALPQFKQEMDALVRFVREQLVEEEDFGVIPGTPRPSLYQPGAQKICFYFALTAVPHLEREIMTAEFVSKTYRMELVDRRTGRVVASCTGSCNSSESRFSKKEYVKKEWTGKYIPTYRDARETENTCDKMAQKRGLVGATLIASRASGIFTQDVEDLAPEQHSVPERSVDEPAAASPEWVTSAQVDRLRELAAHGSMRRDVSQKVKDALEAGLTAAKAQEWIQKFEELITQAEVKPAEPPAPASAPRTESPAVSERTELTRKIREFLSHPANENIRDKITADLKAGMSINDMKTTAAVLEKAILDAPEFWARPPKTRNAVEEGL